MATVSYKGAVSHSRFELQHTTAICFKLQHIHCRELNVKAVVKVLAPLPLSSTLALHGFGGFNNSLQIVFFFRNKYFV